jgi:hypothetical protein
MMPGSAETRSSYDGCGAADGEQYCFASWAPPGVDYREPSCKFRIRLGAACSRCAARLEEYKSVRACSPIILSGFFTWLGYTDHTLHCTLPVTVKDRQG